MRSSDVVGGIQPTTYTLVELENRLYCTVCAIDMLLHDIFLYIRQI